MTRWLGALEVRGPVTGRAFVLGAKQQIPTHILAASRLRMARNDKVVRAVEVRDPVTGRAFVLGAKQQIPFGALRLLRAGSRTFSPLRGCEWLGMTRWSGTLEVRGPVTGRAFVFGGKNSRFPSARCALLRAGSRTFSPLRGCEWLGTTRWLGLASRARDPSVRW